MDRVLIDTSTFIDIGRAPRHMSSPWAQQTLANLVAYQAEHPVLTVSGFTVFEQLDGLLRQGRHNEARVFRETVCPSLDVIYPDEAVFALASAIHAALVIGGKNIGLSDCFIAATAIHHDLALVTANTKHFKRVLSAGFPLHLLDWREA